MGIGKKLLFGALWALALCSGCGMGTETTNGDGVAVAAVDNKLRGTSSDPGATVILCDTRFSPDSNKGLLDTLLLDEKGDFSIETIPDGLYTVFAYPRQANLGTAIQSIPVKAGSAFSDSASFDSLNKVSGKVLYNGAVQKDAAVYILGSPFQTRSDTNGRFAFDKIPDGDFTVIARLVSDSWNAKTMFSDTLKAAIGSGNGEKTGDVFLTFDLKP